VAVKVSLLGCDILHESENPFVKRTHAVMIHIQQMLHVYNATVNALAGFDSIFHSDTMHPILFSLQYPVARRNFESCCTLGSGVPRNFVHGGGSTNSVED